MGRLIAITAGLVLVGALLAGLSFPHVPVMALSESTVVYPIEILGLVIAILLLLACGLSLLFGAGIDDLTKTLALVFGLALVVVWMSSAASPSNSVYIQVAVALLVATLFQLLLSSVLIVVLMLSAQGIGHLLSRRGYFPLQNRFSLFIGWTLLRSHRTSPTIASTARQARYRWLKSGRRGLAWLAAGVALVAAGRLSYSVDSYQVIAEGTSPAFAYLLSWSLVILGGCAFLFGLPAIFGSKADGAPQEIMGLRNWVSLPTFMSVVGVSLGVWALIVVLSVMGGFASDLQSKIVRTNAHVVIEPIKATDVIGTAMNLEDRLRELPNVVEAHSFVSGEVMISSSSNVMVNVVVKGLDRQALGSSSQLDGKIEAGSVGLLSEPQDLVGDHHLFHSMLKPSEVELVDDGYGNFEWRFAEDVPRDPATSPRVPGGPPAAADSGYFKPALYPGIILGAELAKSLVVRVGDEIQVLTPDGDVGPTGLRPKVKSFRVAGIFVSGMYEYDQKMAYMLVGDAQRFFNLDGDTNRLEVRVKDAGEIEETLVGIRSILESDYPQLRALGWKERNRSLFTALELEKIAMFIVLAFIVLVASLLIVSSLVMIIVERVRDIAVLKALGTTNRSVVGSFVVMGAFIGVLGVLSGTILGVGTVEGLLGGDGLQLPTKEYYLNRIPYELDISEIGLVGCSALAICLLATVYPSIIASRLKTVEGLRHD